ncbi:rCG61275 [Rattus norvegicus]|uniref:RCG61275 n=1 Tax=Rattus norvegicus TaxID=10116 RepID=A6KE07_RAT|nr:rCG61275 [Rattus norvegicus]
MAPVKQKNVLCRLPFYCCNKTP